MQITFLYSLLIRIRFSSVGISLLEFHARSIIRVFSSIDITSSHGGFIHSDINFHFIWMEDSLPDQDYIILFITKGTERNVEFNKVTYSIWISSAYTTCTTLLYTNVPFKQLGQVFIALHVQVPYSPALIRMTVTENNITFSRTLFLAAVVSASGSG